MITAAEAAKLLGVSHQTVSDLAAPHGPIPCYRFGAKCTRFNPVTLDEYLRQRLCVPTPAPDLRGGGLDEASLQRRFAALGYDRVSIKPIKRKMPGSSKARNEPR